VCEREKEREREMTIFERKGGFALMSSSLPVIVNLN
jgi:hypothetical protein